MSKFTNYLEITVVFVSVPLIYYYPDYLMDIFIALYAAIFLDLINRNFRNILILNLIYEKYESYKLRRQISNIFEKKLVGSRDIIEKKILDQYRNKLKESAFQKVRSKDMKIRKIGLTQLEQFGDNEIGEKLLEILKETTDKTQERDILKTLCKNSNKFLVRPVAAKPFKKW